MGDNVSECEWCEVVGLRDGSEYCDACSARMCEECLSTHVSYCPDCPPECDCNTKGFTPKEEDDKRRADRSSNDDDSGYCANCTYDSVCAAHAFGPKQDAKRRVEPDSGDDKSCANCTCAHACAKCVVWLCPNCVENKYDDAEVLDAALGLLKMTRADVEATMRPRSPTRRCAKKPRVEDDDDLDHMAEAANAAFPRPPSPTRAPSPTVDEFRQRLRDANRQCLWCDSQDRPLTMCCACHTYRCGGVMCTEAHVHYCARKDDDDDAVKDRHVTHVFPATDVPYSFTPQLTYRQTVDFRPLATPDIQ